MLLRRLYLTIGIAAVPSLTSHYCLVKDEEVRFV